MEFSQSNRDNYWEMYQCALLPSANAIIIMMRTFLFPYHRCGNFEKSAKLDRNVLCLIKLNLKSYFSYFIFFYRINYFLNQIILNILEVGLFSKCLLSVWDSLSQSSPFFWFLIIYIQKIIWLRRNLIYNSVRTSLTLHSV